MPGKACPVWKCLNIREGEDSGNFASAKLRGGPDIYGATRQSPRKGKPEKTSAELTRADTPSTQAGVGGLSKEDGSPPKDNYDTESRRGRNKRVVYEPKRPEVPGAYFYFSEKKKIDRRRRPG